MWHAVIDDTIAFDIVRRSQTAVVARERKCVVNKLFCRQVILKYGYEIELFVFAADEPNVCTFRV